MSSGLSSFREGFLSSYSSKSSGTVYPRYQRTAKPFSALYNGTRLADFVVTKDYALVLVKKEKEKLGPIGQRFSLNSTVLRATLLVAVFSVKKKEVSINIIP